MKKKLRELSEADLFAIYQLVKRNIDIAEHFLNDGPSGGWQGKEWLRVNGRNHKEWQEYWELNELRYNAIQKELNKRISNIDYEL